VTKPHCQSPKGLLWGRAGGNLRGGVGRAARGVFLFKDNLKSNLRKPRRSLGRRAGTGCPARGQRRHRHDRWSRRAAGHLVPVSPLRLAPLGCPRRARTHTCTHTCVCAYRYAWRRHRVSRAAPRREAPGGERRQGPARRPRGGNSTSKLVVSGCRRGGRGEEAEVRAEMELGAAAEEQDGAGRGGCCRAAGTGTPPPPAENCVLAREGPGSVMGNTSPRRARSATRRTRARLVTGSSASGDGSKPSRRLLTPPLPASLPLGTGFAPCAPGKVWPSRPACGQLTAWIPTL